MNARTLRIFLHLSEYARHEPWERLPAEAFDALRAAPARAERRDHRRDPRRGARLRAPARGRLRRRREPRRRGGAGPVRRHGAHPGIGRGAGRASTSRSGAARCARAARWRRCWPPTASARAWPGGAPPRPGVAAGLRAGDARRCWPRRSSPTSTSCRPSPPRASRSEQAARAGEADRRRGRPHRRCCCATPPPARGRVAARPPRPRLGRCRATWPSSCGPRSRGRRPVAPAAARARIAGAADGLVCAVVPDPAAPGRRAEVERAVGGHARRRSGRPCRCPRTAARTATRAAAWPWPRRAGAGLRGRRRAPRGPAAAHRPRARRRDPRGAPGALHDETPASRERLEETLLAWLRHAGGRPRGGRDELHVHPQTVRYRLARLRDLLGAEMDDPDARFELEFALRITPKAR